MSATQHLLEVFTRHQIFLQRYGGSVVRDTNQVLNQLLRDLNSITASTAFQQGRITAITEAVEAIVQQRVTEIGVITLERAEELAEYESGFAGRALGQVSTFETTIPTAQQIIGTVLDSPINLVMGDSEQAFAMREVFEKFSSDKAGEVKRIIQSGMIQGNTRREITRSINSAVGKRARKQTETLVRTITNHTANQSKKMLYEENTDVIVGEEWVSALDSRTTLTCAGLDGKKFDVGEGPYPPRHYNCRSTRVPIINPKFAVAGLTGTRSSTDGQVSSATTYNSFLKRQTPEFQNEVLGAKRAELFRKGGLSIDKFTDDDGIVYNIDDLRGLEPMAFEKTGI